MTIKMFIVDNDFIAGEGGNKMVTNTRLYGDLTIQLKKNWRIFKNSHE